MGDEKGKVHCRVEKEDISLLKEFLCISDIPFCFSEFT